MMPDRTITPLDRQTLFGFSVAMVYGTVCGRPIKISGLIRVISAIRGEKCCEAEFILSDLIVRVGFPWIMKNRLGEVVLLGALMFVLAGQVVGAQSAGSGTPIVHALSDRLHL
jgi:hypothetical protein